MTSHAWGWTIALAAALTGALAGCKAGASSGHAEGKGELGVWSLDSASCFSGQKENFRGVTVKGPDNSGIELKAVKDPLLGWSVSVNKAPTCAGKPESECKQIVYTKVDACKTFDIAVEDTNVKINDVTKVDGHIKLDCDVAGGQIKADLTLDGCH